MCAVLVALREWSSNPNPEDLLVIGRKVHIWFNFQHPANIAITYLLSSHAFKLKVELRGSTYRARFY